MIKQFIFRFKWLMYKIQEQGEQAVATMMDVKDLLEWFLSLIHISEPTRQAEISYAVFCLKKKNI